MELAQQVRITDLQLQDTKYVQLGQYTETEGNIFSVTSNTVRPYEYFDNVHVAIAYEFDLNLYRLDREAYNKLDWLGDIGGLKEALTIMFAFLFGIFNYNKFDDYLVSNMYREATKKDRLGNKEAKKEGTPVDFYYAKHEGNKLKLNTIWCIR